MERLQKVIASSGNCSRRKAEEYIKAGKVYVNNNQITDMGIKVSVSDIITINGTNIKQEEKEYFLLNKPRGIISSSKDEKERKTVVDLINTNKRIYPVGRLDYNTTGLIILTNDGKLTNILTHPSNEVEKTYVVKLNKKFNPSDLHQLRKGIIIDNKKLIPTQVKIKKNTKDSSLIKISIIEGRNHIIKKVFMKMGYLVDALTRIEYGFLTLDTLKSGDYRKLTIKEVKKLYEYKK